jgi:hypothetical protein
MTGTVFISVREFFCRKEVFGIARALLMLEIDHETNIVAAFITDYFTPQYNLLFGP